MTTARKNPDWRLVDNSISAVLAFHYGYLPLSVRNEAAEAARRVVDEWRDPLNEYRS